MKTVTTYFDYISPYSYLLHEQLHRLPSNVTVQHVPVLFAGLLKHWGTLGPVEIERKKLFTYRFSTWVASKLNIKFRIPDSHPFNPLPYLRLTIAMNDDEKLISDIFRAIWTKEIDPATDEGRQTVWNEIGIPDADRIISDRSLKSALFANTREATSSGVFGVPTMIVENQLFWGLDSLDMLLHYIEDSNLFQTESMDRLESIRYGVPPRR